MAIGKPRRPGNDGTQYRTEVAGLRISRTLENDYLAQRLAAAEAKRTAPPEEPRIRGKKCATPEQQLLHIRALREYAGWSMRELAAYCSMPESRIQQITYYQVAGTIVPIETDVPSDAVRPVVPDRRRRGVRAAMPTPQKMAGTMASLEQVRAQRAADAAQATLIEAELQASEAELRLNDD